MWTGLNVEWWCVEWMEHRVLRVDWTEYTVLMRGLDGTSGVMCGLD